MLALLLAACGRQSDGSGAQAPAASAPGAAASVATAPDGLPTDAQKVLNVYNWSDYIDPTVVPA
ncbi:MAG TPA: hypothetical protein VGP20_07800, partial [Steroidobacteraceae bacterium]|nr:hypothetical protein [Steroidobacteraceae bacterium]